MAEPDIPVWAQGLKRNGLYYEGFVDDHETVLELHRKYTTTTYGTRTSSRTSNEDKENKVHCKMNSVIACIQNNIFIGFMYSSIRVQINVNSSGNTEESASPVHHLSWGKQERWIASLDNIIIKKRNKRAPGYLCKEQGKWGTKHTL